MFLGQTLSKPPPPGNSSSGYIFWGRFSHQSAGRGSSVDTEAGGSAGTGWVSAPGTGWETQQEKQRTDVHKTSAPETCNTERRMRGTE